MSYTPSLKDLEDQTYEPSLKDLDVSPEILQSAEEKTKQGGLTASEHLGVLARSQGDRPYAAPRQMQEEFSNPAFWPGFNKLSDEEKKQRLAFSATDPANLVGERYVPGGSMEHPVIRSLVSQIGPSLMPELKAGGGIASRYLINPLVNALARIGSGAAGNVLYALPQLQHGNKLKDMAMEALKSNTLLEIPAAVMRAPGYMAELAYPQRLANETMGNIQKGYNQALREQKDAFDKALIPHGERRANIKKLDPILEVSEDLQPHISTKSKELIDLVKKDPTINNLHALQSQLGKDQMLASRSKDFLKAKGISGYKENIQDYIHKSLNSIDKNAANQYKLGRQITRNKVSPYEATESINKIAESRALDRSPIQVRQALRTALEKKRSGRGEKAQLTVPKEHDLWKHHDNLKNNIEFGKQMRYGVPAAAGAIGAYLHDPSLSGLLTGGAAGAIGAGLGHLGIPGLSQAILNSPLQNVFSKYLSPLYYGGGRGLIGFSMENEPKK